MYHLVGTVVFRMIYGEGVKITNEISPDLSTQPDKIAEARHLGTKLGGILGAVV